MHPILLLMIWALLASMIAAGEPAAALPDDIVRELPPRERLPQGTCRLISTWEAEASPHHLTGHVVDDAAASGGKAWEARVGVDGANRHLIFGPYLDVPEGDYLAVFRLRLLEEADDDITAYLDAVAAPAVKILAQREVWTGDLKRDRYLQLPIAFHAPGGKLECRLFWNGYAGIRLDRVALYAYPPGTVTTLRARSAEPSGEPANLPYRAEVRPFPDIVPRAAQPAARQVVIDLRPLAYDRRLLLQCLQGLVNRERPSIYTLLDDTDRQWLEWMGQRHWIEGEDAITDPMSLIARHRQRIKGVVVYDPRLAASKNVAMMAASVMDGLAASPRLARELNLPVLEDLRGRWQTNAEAYRWAFDTLWPQLNHFVMACLHPDDATGLRDYLYQQRIFTLWITGPIDGAQPGGDPTAEVRVMERILAQAPTNIPMLGFPWSGDDVGIGEGAGVKLFAQYGKFLIGAVGVANLSVHSGFPSPTLRQARISTPPLQGDKVYLTWLMSDGDNLPVLSRNNFPQLWRDATRGRVPIAWSLAPSAVLMIPAVVDWYYAHASANDAFVGAVSGVGYTYPDDFAQRFAPAARQQVFGDFLALTRTCLPRSDLRQLWVMGVSQDAMLDRYAAEVDTIDALFPDYGLPTGRSGEPCYPAARGIPVFHAATSWEEGATRERKIVLAVGQLRAATTAERPAFLHAFIWNWNADLSILPEVMERLGPQYVAVRPEHLAALARQAMAQEQVFVRCPPTVAAIAGCPLRLQLHASNTTATALDCRITLTGLDSASVHPDICEIPAFQALDLDLHGVPAGDTLRLALKGPWGERSITVPVQLVPAGELAVSIPLGTTLHFVDRFDSVGLSHRSGAEQADTSAAAGRVWTATAGATGAGHIVFGPYRPLPAGRYLVLFRLQRTGDGDGDLARIDVHADNPTSGHPATTVTVADAPRGAWRAFPLILDHAGGTIETRVFWPGRASIATGDILVWEMLP